MEITPLRGNMIFGLTSLFHFLDEKGTKADNLIDYMDKWLFDNSLKDITKDTAGVLQDILIAERVVEWYNLVAGPVVTKKSLLIH